MCIRDRIVEWVDEEEVEEVPQSHSANQEDETWNIIIDVIDDFNTSIKGEWAEIDNS